MHPTIEKERELSAYIEEWVAARYSEWMDFYHTTIRDKATGIYRLKKGNELMDLLDDIVCTINDCLTVDEGCHIIPSRFSSISQTIQSLENFNALLKSKHHLIEKNFDGENTSYIVYEMYRMCKDIDQMVTRCLNIYLAEDNIPIPYQQAKRALNDYDVDQFVKLIGSIIKNIPYNIHKEKLDEGYFHTVIHVITSVLGMSPISELETNDGRIDMMLEFPSHIYIMEFKYTDDKTNRSQEALNQIKDNEYANAYYIKGKIIEGVGITFSKEARNIVSFVLERIYTPVL